MISPVEVAAWLGIPIPAADRPSVTENFARLLDQAALVMTLELPEAPEPQPVFEP